MPQYSYIGPTYNTATGIYIPEVNADNWGGLTVVGYAADIFLRASIGFYIFPHLMSDAEILSFITKYPHYAAWWLDTQAGNLTIQEEYFTISPTVPHFTVTAFSVSDSDPNILVFLGKLLQNKGSDRDYTIGSNNVVNWSYTPLEEYQGVIKKITV